MMSWPLPHIFHGTENAMIFALTQLLLVLPIMYVNDKYYKVGFKTLWKRAPNMDSLIALGSSAAVVYGLVALYQIAWGLGHGGRRPGRPVVHGPLPGVGRHDPHPHHPGQVLGDPLQGQDRAGHLPPHRPGPQDGHRPPGRPGGGSSRGRGWRWATVSWSNPAGAIPVDGVVLEGWSSVDESALTGESIPVEKSPGSKVAAASINKSGSFTFEATRVGEDTTLAQMIRLVEEASASKAPIAKLADKVAGVFCPRRHRHRPGHRSGVAPCDRRQHHPGPHRRPWLCW